MKWPRFALVPVGLALLSVAAFAEVTFSAKYAPEAFSGPFSGRVVIYLSKNSNEPRFGPNWFNPEPTLSVKVGGIKPGQAIEIRPGNAVAFPKVFKVENGKWKVQVVFDRNLGGRDIGGSPGNLFSVTQQVEIDWTGSQTVELAADKVVPEDVFQDTDAVKGIALESKLLSAFYKRKTFLRAAVVLPEGYEAGSEKYPILYSVPGFGGSHWSLSGRNRRNGTERDGEKFIYVVLDPSCPTGHSVFADSANNGPWGRALTTELIPHIETKFRAVNMPGARFVTGHSSGGWSSFWLQVAYPDVFGGCWSTSPDPVDFRDFQRINIYRENENAFFDEGGARRPIARSGERVLVYYEPFSDMERPIRGEQLGSFDAVFSPKGKDGEPMRLWDGITGKIDSNVAEAWRKYDISHILRTRSSGLAPKLKGKIHVYMGNEDTFYLEGAVKLLKADLEEMGNPYAAKVEIFPGDHGSVMTRALRDRIDQEVASMWRAFRDAK